MKLVVAATLAFAAAAAAPSALVETAGEVPAMTVLGAKVKGQNWTITGNVRGDGFAKIYAFETPYGHFQVNGERRMNERLQELTALQALEEMSDTDTFADAVANAGLSPVRFGRDLVLDPVETTGNLITGIGNMFDRAVIEVEQSSSSRDSFVDSVVGVKKAMREIAFQLKVDPYTDFTPLRDGLQDVARVMAAGDLSVSAAISAIPGGAGIAVSATSRASTLANPIRDKSSAEIAAIVAKKLTARGVDAEAVKAFLKNEAYSPGDLYAIADALEKLNAENSSAYVLLASKAQSVDVAKFHRYRAELLVKTSAKLGDLKQFDIVSDFALNRDAAGGLVAAFPFDGLRWTETVSRSLTALSEEVAKRGETKKPVFATTGTLSTLAADQLEKRGWKVVTLD